MMTVLPFFMAGDPSLDRLPGLLGEASDLGIDTVEIGLPYSDPVADGPLLQAAAQRALSADVTPRRVLECLAGCPEGPELVLFTYLNPLIQIGSAKLIRLLRPTRVRSLLVVDLPAGEEPEWEADLADAGYPLVPLLAPTTDRARAARLVQRHRPAGPGFARNFVYLAARMGVTGPGGRSDFTALRERVAEVRTLTDRPLAVGFGLDSPAALAAVNDLGVRPVVGSALVPGLSAGKSLRAALSGVCGEF